MAYEFKLPDLGEGLTEGEVARWLVAEGDEVGEDQPLVEIQTDKTTVEIPSPAAGKVSSILVAEGQVVPVGTVLVVIGDGSVSAVESPRIGGLTPQRDDATPGPAGRVQATPVVRKIAAELGVDLAAVTASGAGGRITEDDVRAAAGGGATSEGWREPVRGVRRKIIEHLTRAHREIPAVTFVEECDFTNVELKQLVPLVLQATAHALKQFPELNARLGRSSDGSDEIVYLDRYDLGVAVQTDQGLVVPVVRGCDTRSIEELRADVDTLAAKARDGKLEPADLQGSTFTVTSAGKLSGLLVTPLINHPEVGILGVHRIADRPVARDGAVTIRKTGNISVTFDHRVVDGARAAEFTLAVIARLESR